MNGWRYEWVEELPPEVYDVLIEEVRKQVRESEPE